MNKGNKTAFDFVLRVIQEQEPNRLENPQMYSESLLIDLYFNGLEPEF